MRAHPTLATLVLFVPRLRRAKGVRTEVSHHISPDALPSPRLATLLCTLPRHSTAKPSFVTFSPTAPPSTLHRRLQWQESCVRGRVMWNGREEHETMTAQSATVVEMVAAV